MKNKVRKILMILSCLISLSFTLSAQNPYLPLWEFIPDGEPYVFEDPDCPGKYRVYIYGSHDNLKWMYCGRDQVVWSAPIEDLTRWRYDGVIFKVNESPELYKLNADGTDDVLFAPDVTVTTDADMKSPPNTYAMLSFNRNDIFIYLVCPFIPVLREFIVKTLNDSVALGCSRRAMLFSALFKLIVIAVYLVAAFFFADDTFFFTESRRIGKNGFGFFVCLSNYFFGVLLFFSTTTSALSMSLPGRWNFSTFPISPPST